LLCLDTIFGILAEFEDGEDDMAAFLADHPDMPNVWAELGSAYMQMDRLEDADEAFTNSLRLAESARVRRQYAQLLFDLARMDEALIEIEKSLIVDPKDSEMYRLRGVIFYQKDDIEAVESLNKSIDLDPTRAYPLVTLGGILMLTGKTDESEQYYRKAIALAPDDDYVKVACALYATERGWLKESQSMLNSALEDSPENIEVRRFLATAYFKDNNASGALAQYLTCLELDPEDPDCHNDIGVLYEHMGLLSQAAQEYQDALDLDPEHEKAHTNLDRVNQKL